MTPLNKREGYRERAGHPVTRDLSALATRHGYGGCVLITFDLENELVSVTSCSESAAFGKVMEELADRLLVMIDDGDLDPTVPS